jgi:glycosyltransferase involved in cell wall biosynthesis
LYIKPIHFHFNPGLIFNLLKSRNEIILGSSWNDLNVLVIILLKRIGVIKSKLSIWSEANYLTIYSQKRNALRDVLRIWVFKAIDGSFIIPGEMSFLSFDKWGIETRNIIKLPNLQTRDIFFPSTESRPLRSKPIFLIVARLEEELKGILNFFEAIGIDNLKNIEVRIAGSGNSQGLYTSFIRKNNLDHNIFLLGNLGQNDLSTEYKNADVFLLPSYSDPSPLSVVEALFSGLPLLISNRCGNHYEAVLDGGNGYVFDPYCKIDTLSKFEILMEKRNSWKRFSEKSIELANKNFNPDKISKAFIDNFGSAGIYNF